jgi:hypothetical protein
VASECLPQRETGNAQVLIAVARQHDRPVALREPGNLGREPGLADAGLTGWAEGIGHARVGRLGRAMPDKRPPELGARVDPDGYEDSDE